jgi:hypothetical protein
MILHGIVLLDQIQLHLRSAELPGKAAWGESRPGSESHKGSHAVLLNGDSDIVLGLTEFKGILLLVQRPLKAGDVFDLCCIQTIFSGATQ